ncbi:hypothetical protein [Kaistia terrae]|uniref:DUF4429 domain-containing protein n=1 Tax=Kaistia terrae TaxID=537017 RepID=A0ABW0PWW9_9HYPH|nr:hypothetical protein [Kaistia terrae]MCX5581602.1 hypothetical protein [Kaistia terrae]
MTEMGGLDRSAKQTLDRQLATGAIDVDDYRRRLEALQGVAIPTRSHTAPLESRPKAPMAEFEEISVFDTHISIGNRDYRFTDVVAVEGGAFESRMNLIPYIKSSTMEIMFLDGTHVRKNEEGLFFKGRRHKAIRHLLSLIRKLTFQPCLEELCADLRAGAVKIGMESDTPIKSVVSVALDSMRSRRMTAIYLDREGAISNGSFSLKLSHCRLKGQLELGIHRHQLRQPYSVYASDKKTLMERSPNVALRFDIEGRYRSDVVMALLRWMADGNRL